MKTALFVAPECDRLSCACARSSQFSSTRASLSEKCSLLGTDNVRGQISEHIFAPNEGYCLYNPVNTTRRLCDFLERIYPTSGKEFQVAVQILFQVSVVFEARTIRCRTYFRNSSLPVGLPQTAYAFRAVFK